MDKVALGQGFFCKYLWSFTASIITPMFNTFYLSNTDATSFSEKGQEMKSKHCWQKNLLYNKIMHKAFNNATEFMSLHMQSQYFSKQAS